MLFTSVLIAALLFLSWVGVYIVERKNIFSEWLLPGRQRLKEFAAGFLLMATLCLLTQIVFSLYNQASWSLSDEITGHAILSSLAFNLSSVFFEELLYRGVILYFLIKYVGTSWGLLLTSAAFGIDHWWSYDVWGDTLGMAAVFLTTGFMGYVFATAYAYTKSIILPIGLHLGWNLVNNTVFSGGPQGTGLLVVGEFDELTGTYAALTFLWYMGIPLLVLCLLRKKYNHRGCYGRY